MLLPAQTADQAGVYSGPYEAGAAWACSRAPRGPPTVGDRRDAPGTYPLVDARARAPRGHAEDQRGRRLPRHLLHARREPSLR